MLPAMMSSFQCPFPHLIDRLVILVRVPGAPAMHLERKINISTGTFVSVEEH